MDEGVETALAVTDDLFLIDGMEVSNGNLKALPFSPPFYSTVEHTF